MAVHTMAMTEVPVPPDSEACTLPPRSESGAPLNAEPASSIKVSQKPPTKAELLAVANLPVLNTQRDSIPFKDLYTGTRHGRRVLIIFIRHFFCGNCQEYLRTLCSSITPESLLALPTPTEVVVVGCGQPDLIPFYAATTHCSFPIYADPTKQLYSRLGMARTLNLGQERPDYMQKPLWSVMLHSIYQGLASGRKAFKGGDYWQVGGEFLFEDGAVAWCHRMQNTRDHAEVPELRRRLGLDDERVPMRKRWSVAAGGGIARRLSSSRSRSWSRKRASVIGVPGEAAGSKEGSLMGKVNEDRSEGITA